MPTLNDEQQPSVPATTPPSSPDLTVEVQRLQKELTAAQRSYDGLDGNFKKTKQERDSLDNEIKSLSQQYEAAKKNLEIERDNLKTVADQKAQELTTLQTKQFETEGELEALRMVMTDFPDLAPMFGKGLIRTGGLKGEELKTFLAQWSDSLKQLGTDFGRQRNSGTTLPSPNPEIGSMTLDQASDRKLEALRQFGPNSKEYQQYAKIEDDLIRQRKRS